MVIDNSITSENLITVKELINNWQITSISKKKKFVWKIRVNSTRLVTQSTRNPINPAQPAHFAASINFNAGFRQLVQQKVKATLFFFLFLFFSFDEWVKTKLNSALTNRHSTSSDHHAIKSKKLSSILHSPTFIPRHHWIQVNG